MEVIYGILIFIGIILALFFIVGVYVWWIFKNDVIMDEQLCNDIDDMIASAWTYPINYKYTEKQNKIEKENVMRKSDLSNGDIVELRDGEKYIVLFNAKDGALKENFIISLKDGNLIKLNGYNDDLTWKGFDMLDIIKVCSKNYVINNFRRHVLNLDINKGEKSDWTWIREEKREMTISEIEEELGYSIKIVKE